MAAYRLSSQISPIGPRGHRITVSAIAADQKSEEVRMDIAETIVEAESRRAVLLVLLENRLRKSGHEVVDLVDE